jgi:hypothetical protein
MMGDGLDGVRLDSGAMAGSGAFARLRVTRPYPHARRRGNPPGVSGLRHSRRRDGARCRIRRLQRFQANLQSGHDTGPARRDQKLAQARRRDGLRLSPQPTTDGQATHLERRLLLALL